MPGGQQLRCDLARASLYLFPSFSSVMLSLSLTVSLSLSFSTNRKTTPQLPPPPDLLHSVTPPRIHTVLDGSCRPHRQNLLLCPSSSSSRADPLLLARVDFANPDPARQTRW